MNRWKQNIVVLLWIVIVLWLFLIFFLSDQPAIQSKNFSGQVAETIIKAIVWLLNLDIDIKELVNIYDHWTRKLAHVTIYFVLGFLVITVLIKTNISRRKASISAILFCIFYAMTDEIHQTFVFGRGGQVSDVLIDTIGASLGIGIFYIYDFFRKK